MLRFGTPIGSSSVSKEIWRSTAGRKAEVERGPGAWSSNAKCQFPDCVSGTRESVLSGFVVF